MKDIVKLGLNLFVISAVAALLLAFTNTATAKTIEQRNEETNAEARKLVLETAKDFEEVKVKADNKEGVEVAEVYKALDGSGETVGYTLKVLPSGYGGEIQLMVGIDSKSNKVSGINVVSNSETAGLGAKATDPAFSDQYKGKPIQELAVIKNGEPKDTEIKAISGATITSTAVTNGVNAAIEVYNNALK